MGWGRLNREQAETIAQEVRGRTVYDLGAGDGSLARWCLRVGAAGVVAVEKEKHFSVKTQPPGLEWVHAYFADYRLRAPDRLPVAVVSWPQNNSLPGLAHLCARAEVLIYVGKNSDDTICGNQTLYHYLHRRPLLRYVASWYNDVAVYGTGSVLRLPTPEERAGMHPSRNYSWEELHPRALSDQGCWEPGVDWENDPP